MKKIICILALFTIVSCKGGGGGGASSNTNLAYSSFLGNWMFDAQDSTCETVETVSYKPYISFVEEDGEKIFLLGNFFYQNTNCTDSFVGMQAIGYNPSLNQDDVNFNYIDEIFMIVDSSFLTWANSNSFCDINDWELGEFKSIAGTRCSGNPPTTFIWNNVSINGSTLSFKDNEGSTVTLYKSPDKNHISINSNYDRIFSSPESLNEDSYLEIENILMSSRK